jgi:hypothetical protein
MIAVATKFAPTPAAYETAARAGFREAELWTDEQVLSGWRDVVALARQFPFRHAFHFPNRVAVSPETLAHTAELYHALDCRAVVIHQPQFDRHGAALTALAPGIRLAVENHRLTPSGFRAWAEDNPGLALDVEHLWKFTLDDCPLDDLLAEVRRFLERFRPKLHHVHMPGYLPGQPNHRPMYCSRDMVFAVLSLLEEYRFDGLIVSEVETEFQNIHDLQMDVLLFRRWQALRGAA